MEALGIVRSPFKFLIHKVPSVLLMLPPLLLITGFLIYPVTSLLLKGLGSALTIQEPLPAYLWPHLFMVTRNTFLLGFLTTAGSLLAAFPLAFLLVRTDLIGYRIWLSVLTIPMITPPFIMSFAVLSLYGRSGVISLLLQKIGIYLPHIFGLPGLLIMQLTVSIPYATFIIAAGLQGVPRHLDETAASLGANPFRIWFTVTIPCIYPHLIISGLMIFFVSIGDVGGPLIIGGGFSVLATEIYTSFLSLLNDDRIALIFILWIILLSFLLLSTVNWLLRLTVRQYRTGTNPYIYKLSHFRRPATLFVGLFIGILLLPFLIVVVQSFIKVWSYEILPRGWTLSNYQNILSSSSGLMDTIVLVALTAPTIVILSIILGHTMYVRRKWRFLNFVLVIPFVLPGLVLAVGVLDGYTVLTPREHSIPFFFLLILTIIMRRLPYSLKTLEAGFLIANPRREEIAQSLGSNPFSSFIKITVPQLQNFIFAAFIIGLIKTATEISASLILAPPNWQSLSLGIIFLINQGELSRASAQSILLIALVGIGTFWVAFWSQTEARKKQNEPNDALERLVLGKTPLSFTRYENKKKRNFSLFGNREPLLIVTDRFGITDANRSFLNLVGADTVDQLQAETSFSMLFFGDNQVLEIFTATETIENRATSIMRLNGSRIPIILNAYIRISGNGTKTVRFYCRRVSGYARRIREYSRLRERMSLAEQTALKAQITPHFLFNSLNSVIELIDSNPDEARDVVQNLAELYRYILFSTKQNLVSVEREIQSIQHYLAVEKARFGSNLSFEIHADQAARHAQVPPMLLQPLVENAVTHGAKDTGEIIIRVTISIIRDDIIFQVMDHGSKIFDHSKIQTGSGTGLKNVEGRLFALYHRKVSYETGRNGGLTVSFAVPRNIK